MQQGIHQRSAVAGILGCAGPSMDHHSGRLVHDGQIIVFIHDLKRNRFRNGAQRRPLNLSDDSDFLAAPQAKGCFLELAVHENFVLRNQFLDTRAAGFLEL
jgi:hypothetical protein